MKRVYPFLTALLILTVTVFCGYGRAAEAVSEGGIGEKPGDEEVQLKDSSSAAAQKEICARGGSKGEPGKVQSAPSSPEPVKFLDPEVFDAQFDKYVGSRVGAVTRDAKLAIPKLPVFDDALDTVTKYSPFDYELGYTLTSKYIWRGQNLTPPRACLQPYVKMGTKFLPLGKLAVTWWANYTSRYQTDDTEHDFYFDYNVDLLAVTKMAGVDNDRIPYLFRKALDCNLATGIWYYFYPFTRDSTQEYYGTVTMNWPLHPYFMIVNDYKVGGIWYELGVCESFDLKAFTVNSYAKFGYNHKQYCRSSKLQTFEYGFSLPIPIGTHMRIEPFISHSIRLHRTYFYTQVEGTDADGNPILDEFGTPVMVDQGNVLTKNEFYGGFKYVINF